jgi:ABC-type branched-subunit amino acid transport system substrate-binding protein
LPDEAESAVERLVRDHNVIAIIGDISSRTAPVIAAKAKQYGVPVLSLTQRSDANQSFVFYNSLTYQAQAKALVSYARSRLGVERFGIVFPSDNYGQDFSQIFWDEVLAQGGQVVGAQSYPPRETDFSEQVRKLLGLFYLEARAQEVRLIERERAKEPASRRKTDIVERLQPFNHVQAVFIPDSIAAMGQISARLSFFRASHLPILGPNLWNQSEVIRRAGRTADRIYFVDHFNLAAAEVQESEFVRSHQRYFQESPSSITLYGYDSALLLRHLIASGHSGRDSLTRALASIRNVPGALTPLSVGPQRDIQRPVQVLGIRQNQIQTLEILQ